MIVLIDEVLVNPRDLVFIIKEHLKNGSYSNSLNELFYTDNAESNLESLFIRGNRNSFALPVKRIKHECVFFDLDGKEKVLSNLTERDIIKIQFEKQIVLFYCYQIKGDNIYQRIYFKTNT